ncbi:hypothetical protein BDP27DRAFT_572570 [Rhodocollybia butyracea]|uniref:Uncharacterized protein n=1 Tax=Rhodocollybia butyracea TaxID=206335 RepID=A0A9P5PXG8_9AGAR|nr:hypothetical protein BDP27DRAFT_572570 [Rhodocollybia butyracea]
MQNDTGALKRKRVDSGGLLGPDGFVTAKPSKSGRTSAPSFQSAFSTAKKKPDTKIASATRLPISDFATLKPVAPHKPALPKPAPRSDFILDSQFPAERVTDGSNLAPTIPAKPAYRANILSHSIHGMKPLPKPFPRPVLSSAENPSVSSESSSSSKPSSKLKAPILPVLQDPSSIKTPAKSLLKSIAPPRISPWRPVIGHKVLPAQLQLQPSTPPSKPLRTIATTRVARATDISTENGTAELASIFLQDPADSETADITEIKSGLDVSPQKGNSGRGLKFLRNGLAAHAASYLTHTNTSLVLWAKESSTRSRLPKADLRLRVIKIIHHPSLEGRASSTAGLALCCLHDRLPFLDNDRPAAEFPVLDSEMDTRPAMVLVLFSFAHDPSPPTTPIRNAGLFKEDAEFWVWKPWRTLPLSNCQIHSFSLEQYCETKVENTVLFCQRFGHYSS